MASKYASLTPYNYSFNDPVTFNDPNGADPYDNYNGGGGYYFSGGYYTYDDVAPNNMGEFHSAFGWRDSYSMGFLASAMGYGASMFGMGSGWKPGDGRLHWSPFDLYYRGLQQNAEDVKKGNLSPEQFGQIYGARPTITDYFTNGDRTRYIDSRAEFYIDGQLALSLDFYDPSQQFSWEVTWGETFRRIKEESWGPSWISYVPLFGPIRDAVRNFSEGQSAWDYAKGVGNMALAVSDVFLVKSLVTGGIKLGTAGLTRTFGIGRSPNYGAAVVRWKKAGILPEGYKHHWFITQEMMKEYPKLKPLGNQLWNLTSFSSQASHMRWAHSQIYKGIGYPGASLLYPLTSTPTWFKAGAFSLGGRFID